MITPAYSSTATERVLPRLALDFTTGALDPRVTVTRALNTATRINSSGLIVGVNADLPRFDYDPVTRAPRGLLIEETRSNVCIRSAEFNTGWSANAINVGQDSTTSPSGSVDADRLTAVAGSAQHRLLGTSATVTSNAPLTHSVFVKANGFSFFQIHDAAIGTFYANFDVSLGVVTASNPVGGATISPLGNGWYRCTLSFTTGVTSSIGVVAIIPDGSAARNPTWTAAGTESIFAWGYQIEAGAFATSYIPTTTTSLTRNADVVSMTGANFSSWYNASEGAFAAQFFSFGSSTGAVMQAGIGNNTNERVAWYTTASNFVVSNSTGVNQAALGNSSLINVAAKVCGAYKVDSFAAAINGGTVATDNTGTVTAPNALSIGHRNTASPNLFLNGWVQKLNYWPQRLTNAEVQAFSK